MSARSRIRVVRVGWRRKKCVKHIVPLVSPAGSFLSLARCVRQGEKKTGVLFRWRDRERAEAGGLRQSRASNKWTARPGWGGGRGGRKKVAVMSSRGNKRVTLGAFFIREGVDGKEVAPRGWKRGWLIKEPRDNGPL